LSGTSSTISKRSGDFIQTLRQNRVSILDVVTKPQSMQSS
jgi:hypothetical protein